MDLFSGSFAFVHVLFATIALYPYIRTSFGIGNPTALSEHESCLGAILQVWRRKNAKACHQESRLDWFFPKNHLYDDNLLVGFRILHFNQPSSANILAAADISPAAV